MLDDTSALVDGRKLQEEVAKEVLTLDFRGVLSNSIQRSIRLWASAAAVIPEEFGLGLSARKTG